jgi:uncharacterized membrane protein
MTLAATLYTRAGCHLCEDALADLERLRARYPHTVRQVNVLAQPELAALYGERVPVLEVGGCEYAAPLPLAVLERALREATQTNSHDRAKASAADQSTTANAYDRANAGAADQSTTARAAEQTTPPSAQVRDKASADDQNTTANAYERAKASTAHAAGAPNAEERPARVAHSLGYTGHERPERGASIGARGAMRHWLFALNLTIGLFLAGAIATPVLAAFGWRAAADALYAAYHFTCHQWAFRSFFLFGQQPTYAQEDLLSRGFDPYTFLGSPTLGWKMGFCERDLAIYVGVLLVSLAYARNRGLRALGFLPYGVLILPIVLDGFTQLFGLRESTWELRVFTGLLFGLASAALVLPRLDVAFGLQPAAADYPHSTPLCEPVSPLLPRGG